MGIQSRRQVRAALTFVARPLLFAIFLTVFARVFFSSGGSKTVGPPPQPESHSPPSPEAVYTQPDVNSGPGPGDGRDGRDGRDGIAQKSHHDLHHNKAPAGAAHENHHDDLHKDHRQLTTALVVASTSNMAAADTAWIADVPDQWQPVYHYVADAPLTPELAVPVNKGNEAMVYLTYIVDHYDALPDVVLFHHGHRRGWHQAMDSLEEVRRLRPSYVARRGYASLRCLPGCENVIVLANYAVERSQFPRVGRDVRLTTLLDDFLDKENLGEKVPVRLASPCCAQFAASRQAIQRRSRAWWTSLRQWVVDTPLSNMESGRLMEHTWHVWLGNESYHCPEYAACQCHVYGIGDNCEAYYALEESM